MPARRTLADYGVTTYRTRLALSNGEWAKLRHEAASLHITGAQLIERILVDVCMALPVPPSDPLPEPPPPDDHGSLEVIE